MSTENIDIEIQDPVTPEVVEIKIDENSAQSAVAAAAAAQAALTLIQTYLTQLNQSNIFLEILGIEIDGNDITFEALWRWLLQNIPYSNPAAITHNIPFAAEGKSRIDMFLATNTNTIIRYPCPEVTLPAPPIALPVPINTLMACFVIVTDSTISAPILETTPIYVGLYESEESFDGGVPRAPYGSFGFIKNATQTILCLCLGGTDWTFLELNPFKKVILWNPSDSPVFELPRGVQVRMVFVNGTIVNSTQDPALAAYNKWTQIGSSIVIANEILFEENSIISIFN